MNPRHPLTSPARARTDDAPQHSPAPDWRASAACRDYGNELFFPPRGGDERGDDHRASIARAVCATCPVRPSCLAVALGAGTPAGPATRAEPHLLRPSQLAGIWGGTNERERRALRRQLAAGRPMDDVVAAARAPSAERHPRPRPPGRTDSRWPGAGPGGPPTRKGDRK